MKFGFDWFRRRCLKMVNDDGRTDDGACLYYKLTHGACLYFMLSHEPKGSGALKIR